MANLINYTVTGTTGNSAATVFNTGPGLSEFVIAQVVFTTAGTALIQGRAAPDIAWVTAYTFTEASSPLAVQVARFPEMRVSVSALSVGHTAHVVVAG